MANWSTFEFTQSFTDGLNDSSCVLEFHFKMHDFIDILEFSMIC